MVLDPQGRVVSLNQAAEKILRVTTREAKGRLVREWLPVYPEAVQPLPDDFETEVSLGEGSVQRYFTLSSSLLKDFRGLPVGRLVMLRDITEQKQTQAQILEQQRALAILQERERLAREIHDGIGQVLGYVKVQAHAARDRLIQGQTTEVDGLLAQLITVAQDAHADVREYILGAKAATAGQVGQVSFLPRLRQFLIRFNDVYGLRAELIVPPDWSDDLLEPTVDVQLMRIIQEALTNARKHARATCVQVIFQPNGSRAQVTIRDDGIGFDAALVPEGMGQNYGLGFLRERAAEVGGSVTIYSAPGQGTSVLVDVPRRV